VALAGNPLGALLAGVLLQSIGARSTALIFLILMLLLALATTLSPHIRNAPPLVAT